MLWFLKRYYPTLIFALCATVNLVAFVFQSEPHPPLWVYAADLFTLLFLAVILWIQQKKIEKRSQKGKSGDLS
jgi:ABC-type transport system involved in cytochrome bd biosynthesis fused ATPase/permease subunit